MALPKGGLISEHVLILPIGHYGASTDAPEVRGEGVGKRTVFVCEVHLCRAFKFENREGHRQFCKSVGIHFIILNKSSIIPFLWNMYSILIISLRILSILFVHVQSQWTCKNLAD